MNLPTVESDLGGGLAFEEPGYSAKRDGEGLRQLVPDDGSSCAP